MGPPDPPEEMDLALDYLAVRTAIGWLGILLPVVLGGGALALRFAAPASISDYYWTPLRDLFVGYLCALGVFLLSYRGYGKGDLFASQFAGLFALGVALLPDRGKTGPWHYASAGLFFFTTALTALFLFTKSTAAPGERPADKRLRNAIYRACGVGILLSLAVLAADGWLHLFAANRGVFWMESVCVGLFGVAWLVKGEALAGALAAVRTALTRRGAAGPSP